ncbi:hypothetical protein NIES4075_65080 [Tolypothrix sp. NIES-4075]|uniref:plasmid replication protein, CyRepA1 family n=1 Tax=Tolypothrix sp. NIES-4075 TaxID=2005459 RepID=UPI000B5CCCFF|nr:plasmid replication protein, CyRepA1 family [Tolypothrix sp. NIES-4075]GAX45487.1 hypothetical protein NIES4075_65080 [Tolypothrix sp. NIES-4075]
MKDNPHSQHPNDLTVAEYHELAVGSAIHHALIEANFIHIEGVLVYSYLFISEQIKRKNAGRVTDSFLKQYQHAESGGLWISGLDPQNNWQPMEWGRFKPTFPRINAEKGKLVKYESPPKTPNRVTYFDIPDCIWDLVALRYNIKRYNSPLTLRLQDRLHPLLFWEWVIRHPEIPIILCEGEKKAACLLSLGFAAIALPGIWNGRVGKKDLDERLHPDLLPLAQPGRKFIILFDYETNPKTRWSVFQATLRTGKAIEAAGSACEVAQLPGMEKGVDDFVVARGDDASALLTAIIDDAKTLSDYQRSFYISQRGLSSKYSPHIRVNVKYLSQEIELPESGLVVLDSDMGTGKTELLSKWRDSHPQARFLNNGHRVNLLKNLANRLKTEMYSDLGYTGLAKATALSITIDSLHKLCTDSLTYGCVFIDEACQYLTHLLHSKTCKEHRAEILEVLEYIVYNAPLVVIADAHMDDVTVDFFRAMRPPSEKPFIIKNEWKNGDRPIHWYEGSNSSALVAKISAALMLGKKVMVVSDSKRFIKKLEKLLNMRLVVQASNTDYCTLQAVIANDNISDESEQLSLKGDDKKTSDVKQPLRVWAIHSENSGSEENVAFIKDITNAVKSLDALLASPSLGTGVDIPEYHFDAVFGVFHAVSQTATECAQQLWRYRPNVPIHVWVAPRPPFGYKETNASKIKERLLQTNEMTAFLIRIDRETGRRGAEKDWALNAYCQIMAKRHQSINNLRADLRDLLTEMRNVIIPMGTEKNYLAQKQLKNAGIALDAAYYTAVASSNEISATEYRQRTSKDYLSPEEVFECEKFRIKDAYGMEVTSTLVQKDNSGKLIKAIADLEAILSEPDGTIVDPNTGDKYPAPPTIVADKDRQERLHLALCMDWGNYSASWLARFNLGLHDILKRLVAGVEVTASDPDLVRMTEIAKSCPTHVKAILGFTVPPKSKPIWLLGTLLDQLGLKLDDHKVGPRGKQVKYHLLSQEELDFALAVIRYRDYKRQAKEERIRQAAEEQRRYQARLQLQYGIAPPNTPVSTPPPNSIVPPLGEGVDTKVENIDFVDFDPEDGDPTPIRVCVEQLRSGIKHGVDAIKDILQRWSEDRRWCAVLLLEKIAAAELRMLEQMMPQFYTWLS